MKTKRQTSETTVILPDELFSALRAYEEIKGRIHVKTEELVSMEAKLRKAENDLTRMMEEHQEAVERCTREMARHLRG